MSFFQRLLNYMANEVITKQLARSQLFQRAAMKTHHHVTKLQSAAKEGAVDKGESFKGIFDRAASEVGEFGAALKNEVAKDVNRVTRRLK